ncbi:MAG TPA: DUF3054 domain-containing protein [Anaerolineaceae bacterium]|nr:DUF3054 domain-containing protein [Anaerolineaceae bacterium]
MQTRELTTLAGGDAAALAILTGVGFASHGELGTAGMRILATFIPLCIAWALIAPWLGLYDPATIRQPRQLWRPVLATFLAAPIAGLMRALLLNAGVIIPVFVLVLGATGALILFLWRSVWLLLRNRQVNHG